MFLVDLFFTQPGQDDPVHFERKWLALPEVGDTVAVESVDQMTGDEISMHIGVVERRAFLSAGNGELRVQLTMVPETTAEPVETAAVGSADTL